MRRAIFLVFAIFISASFVFGFELNPIVVKTGVRGEDSVAHPVKIFNDGVSQFFSVESFSRKDFLRVSESEIFLEAGADGSFEIFVDGSGLRNGVYLGRVEVRGSEDEQKIPIVFERESDEVDFDAIIQIPQTYAEVASGENFLAYVDVYSLAFFDRPVIVKSYIEDFYGNVLAEETDEVSLENVMKLTKSFDIPFEAEDGDYVFYVEVISQDSFATSTAFFRVSRPVQLSPSSEGSYLPFIIISVLILSFLIFNFLWRHKLMSVATQWKGRISSGKLLDVHKEFARLNYERSLLDKAYEKKFIKKSSYEEGKREITRRIRKLKKRL